MKGLCRQRSEFCSRVKVAGEVAGAGFVKGDVRLGMVHMVERRLVRGLRARVLASPRDGQLAKDRMPVAAMIRVRTASCR